MTIYNVFILTSMFVVPFIIMLTPILLGQQYGIFRSKQEEFIHDTAIGTVAGAAIGLLAFMLAFTFQMVSDRFEARKELLLEEITTIQTVHLRGRLIPEPYSTETKKLTHDFLMIRIALAEQKINLTDAINQSENILNSLWNITEDLAIQDRSSEVYALYTTSINDLIDIQNKRYTIAVEYRIPTIIYIILTIITIFSMFTLGYQFGVFGKGNIIINILLSIIFSVAMFLILVLDNPTLGVVTVNQHPYYILLDHFNGLK